MLAVHAGYMAGVNPDDNWARVEAEARRILDAEQPAPTCETCGGTCARCQGSRLTQTGDQCLPCMEGKPVPCHDCAGEEGSP